MSKQVKNQTLNIPARAVLLNRRERRGLGAAFGRNQMVFKENGVAFHYGDGANKHRPVEKGRHE